MSTVLCDFTVIIDHNDIAINIRNPEWFKDFDTGGCHENMQALLIFNAEGHTNGGKSADISLNNINENMNDEIKNVIGHIYPSTEKRTHIFTIPEYRLRSRSMNRIRIDAPELFAADVNDELKVSDMVCFFHQSD